MDDYLTAREATAALGIKSATLYSYVSRGLVRTLPNPRGRGNLYARGDIERLKAKGAAHAGKGPAASAALNWGAPLIQSAITDVRDGQFYYRGHPAVRLAEDGVSFERVAELLWRCPPGEWRPLAPERLPGAGEAEWRGVRPFDVLGLVLVHLAAGGAHVAADEPARARALLATLVRAVALPHGAARVDRAWREPTLASGLAAALGCDPRRHAPALDRALVLCADHELNASAFAARIVASTDADLQACLTTALCALSGPRHAGSCDKLETLLAGFRRPGDVAAGVEERLAGRQPIAAFGHPLYPDGDPRVAPLLAIAGEIAPDSERLAVLAELVRVMRAKGFPPPTLEIGLVAVCGAIGAPAGSAKLLFALGRLAGIIAHVAEQRLTPGVLRPRARFVGSDEPPG